MICQRLISALGACTGFAFAKPCGQRCQLGEFVWECPYWRRILNGANRLARDLSGFRPY